MNIFNSYSEESLKRHILKCGPKYFSHLSEEEKLIISTFPHPIEEYISSINNNLNNTISCST